jgi:hypothetical protein
MRPARLVPLVLLGMVVAGTIGVLSPRVGDGGIPTGLVGGDLRGLLIDDLHLEPHQADRWGEGLVSVGGDWWAFGFGGDAEVPATLEVGDVPWSQPTTIGVGFVRWQDEERLPVFGDPMFHGPGFLGGSSLGGPHLNAVYAIGTVTMADELPLALPRDFFSQFDLVLDVPGRDRWHALPQFPDDTWNQGALVLSLRLEATAAAFNVYSFSAGAIVTEQVPGFVAARGDTILMGVEVSEQLFPEGVAMLAGRLAVDIRDHTFPPQSHRVVTAPAGPLDEGSFFPYLGIERIIVPGYPGMLDIVGVTPIHGPDGNFWFGLHPAVPWPGMPPTGFFSDFIQVGFAPPGESPTAAFGFQTHDGIDTTFGPGPDGQRIDGPGHPAFVTSLGDIVFATTIPFTDDRGYAWVQSGFLITEDAEFQSNLERFPFGPADVVTSDAPATVGGGFPVYDLAAGVAVEPPTEDTTTTTTTTSTTVATEPPAAGPVTEPPDEVGEGDCAWCWAVIIVFAALLVAIIFLRLRAFAWWSCWIAWFIVIILWVPILLAGLWFWQVDWWRWPLLAWFPIVAGYGWGWAPRQRWWLPWMTYVIVGYLAVLALVLATIGNPEWWALFPTFWLPLVVFHAWFRGRHQRWWRPWTPWLLVGHAAWVLVWVAWLPPHWLWWFPVALVLVIVWWFTVSGTAWAILLGPKWSWIIPFALIPILAFGIPLWCTWWCVGVIPAVVVLTILAASTHRFWAPEELPPA